MILTENTSTMTMKQEHFETEWGTARLRKDGYYYISTKKHNGCLLHRLIYEKYCGPIPNGYVVHHIDGNKQNNEISNLVLLSRNEHHQLHHWGCGRIDKAGGIKFLSEQKNQGKTMSMISQELGYTQPVPVHQYLKYRDLRWNEL